MVSRTKEMREEGKAMQGEETKTKIKTTLIAMSESVETFQLAHRHLSLLLPNPLQEMVCHVYDVSRKQLHLRMRM